MDGFNTHHVVFPYLFSVPISYCIQFVFVICICIVVQLVPLLKVAIVGLIAYLCICLFMYLCIHVFEYICVFVYLCICALNTCSLVPLWQVTVVGRRRSKDWRSSQEQLSSRHYHHLCICICICICVLFEFVFVFVFVFVFAFFLYLYLYLYSIWICFDWRSIQEQLNFLFTALKSIVLVSYFWAQQIWYKYQLQIQSFERNISGGRGGAVLCTIQIQIQI